MKAHDTMISVVPCAPDAVRLRPNSFYADAPARYRDRDIGIGYGRSSGYALGKRYSSDWGSPRFRFR